MNSLELVEIVLVSNIPQIDYSERHKERIVLYLYSGRYNMTITIHDIDDLTVRYGNSSLISYKSISSVICEVKDYVERRRRWIKLS